MGVGRQTWQFSPKAVHLWGGTSFRLWCGGDRRPKAEDRTRISRSSGWRPTPRPPATPPPPSQSVVGQIGATLLEFDFSDEQKATLRLGPSSDHGSSNPGALIVSAPLMDRETLFQLGINTVMDFYVVQLPPQETAINYLTYLIIDTGTTMTLLSQSTNANVNIKFPLGSINVEQEDLGVLPSNSFANNVGILGNRTMSGYIIRLDMSRMPGTLNIYKK